MSECEKEDINEQVYWNWKQNTAIFLSFTHFFEKTKGAYCSFRLAVYDWKCCCSCGKLIGVENYQINLSLI